MDLCQTYVDNFEVLPTLQGIGDWLISKPNFCLLSKSIPSETKAIKKDWKQKCTWTYWLITAVWPYRLFFRKKIFGHFSNLYIILNIVRLLNRPYKSNIETIILVHT